MDQNKLALSSKTERELTTSLAEKDKIIASLLSENYSLYNIITLIPGNVFWKDTTGKFLGCNNNVAQILGLSSPDEIRGKRNSELFDSILAKLADTIDQEVCITAKEKYTEEIGLNIDKQPAIYLTKKIPLLDEQSKVTGILGVSFDITERKKMEEDLKIAKEKAEASNKAKSQFLAIVNHELRTPLASIIGLIDFLKTDSLPLTEKENIIEAIENCSQHLLSLVNDILDISSLEAKKQNLRLVPIHLHDIIYEVYAILKPLADKKGLELQVQLSAEIPTNIQADARILRQILINLANNAIKFTEKGRVTIQIDCINQSPEKTQLTFKVIDTGAGIPTDKLDLIFEPFLQLENAYIRHSTRTGTGLGLTIVKKLAESINAEINVTSKLGKGSTFSVVGEFNTNTDTENANDSSPALELEKNIQKNKIYPDILKQQPTILLIEDDPIIQFIHKKMLEDLGCLVDIAPTGKEALAMLDKHSMVLADISLPDISGFDVIKAIRQSSKNNLVPIVALTVYTGSNEKTACLTAGANEFASKPISQKKLHDLLMRYLCNELTTLV